jgi:pteridine reductase
MGRLSGRTALVTGAARRIGRAIALALAGEGADVLVHHHRSEGDAAETAVLCGARGVRADLVRADLLDPADVERLAGVAIERGVDVLVHNASTFTRTPFLETDAAVHAERLRRDLAIHVEAPFVLGRRIGEAMARRGFGRFVLLGDWSAEAAAYPHYASYLVSKGAVPMLARVLAVELGGLSPGVTVNAVLPGPILPTSEAPEDDLPSLRRRTVLGRWIGAEEVARAVVYLAESEGTTGTVLRVDGGRAAKGG